MRFKLRQEEEALAVRETPPESSLSRMVEKLVFKIDNRGPILECSFKDLESGLVELQATHVLLRPSCSNIIMFHCLVVLHEHMKCGVNVRKLDRGEEKM